MRLLPRDTTLNAPPPDLPPFVYQSIKVGLSENGGKTWKPPITVTELDNNKNGKGVVDKAWLAVDTSNGQRQDTLYVAWNRFNFDNQRSELWCTALPPGARVLACT
jgi:hypothetical protein